ncbi:RND family efflux transporter MFP subunit [Ferroglobus placidus DSM 10642]|uniref:RND family efflux transporter MFP subunit n=1 Tax=Ferroglobus placidus (strain DSM 10642 / AEDII12DO) TaxID=589924 RepID=D3RY13_FERPA|nr:hypothetical protein [Ferroglobus placidus]ADC65376.1 RND family efflux transporter MFP subunit [Ferroglobus placidus DSM 10642]
MRRAMAVLLILVMLGSVVTPVMAVKTLEPPVHPPKFKVKIPEPSQPLNESELSHIVIPLHWLLKNDQDERPEWLR